MGAVTLDALAAEVAEVQAEVRNLEARFEARLDAQADANQMRAGGLEELVIAAEAASVRTRQDTSAARTEVNNLRHYVQERFDNVDRLLSELIAELRAKAAT